MSESIPEIEALNPEQRDAVLAIDRPVLVLAGAGSGKTRVITHKIAYLVRRAGYPPESILALTFTNKAAGEMRSRAARMLGPEAERATIGTFHAIGLRILRAHASTIGRKPGFVVYDAQDQETLIKRVLKHLNVDPKVFRPVDVLRGIEKEKRLCRGPETTTYAPPGSFEGLVARAYPVYEERLRDANAVDFGDLLWRVAKLFQEHPEALAAYQWRWRYVLVDEFQDTNHAQYKMMRQLVERSDGSLAGLTVVGDDDQSIYGWRGAHVGNILSFPDHFPGCHVVRLEQNYRSSANILEAAGEVIARNARRHPKRLWTEEKPGAPLELHQADTEIEEADWAVRRLRQLRDVSIPLRETAVFYRTNAQSRPFEDALRRANVPYQVVGGLRFYERKEVKDVLAYLRLLANPSDDVSLTRIVNVPRRGIGDTTVERLLAHAAGLGTSAWDALPAFAAATRAAAGKRLAEFRSMMEDLLARAAGQSAYRTIVDVLETTQYLDSYDDGSVESESRIENVRELVNAVEVFCERRASAEPAATTLAAYLDDVALVSDIDMVEEGEDAVTLMTVHSAKGLEFDAVVVAGLEERIFPHANSMDDEERLEEERRLFYVALTRARHRVFLTLARQRRRYGALDPCDASRFLGELPRAVLQTTPGSLQARRASFAGLGGDGAWGGGGAWGAGAGAGRLGRAAPSSGAGAPATPEPHVAYDEDSGFDVPQTIEEAVGRRVRHPVFGTGRVTGGRGDRVYVEFPGAGTKLIIGRFLHFLD